MVRPRTFCEEEALDKALDVFWRHGYEGATLKVLTEAMGINRPSMYAAFGNKEDLFRQALARYTSIKDAVFEEAFTEPDARSVVRHLLRRAAEMMTEPGNPVGCLSVQGCLSGKDENEPVRLELAKIRARYHDRVEVRFADEKAAGRLPADAEPGELAMLLSAIANGMAVQAASGATREELLTVAENAARVFPTQAQPQTAAAE